MCKLLFLSKIEGLNVKENIKPILKIMEKGNADGIGMFSESGMSKAISVDDLLNKNSLPFCYDSESFHIGKALNGTSLAVHSRISTNYLGLDYSHPFDVNGKLFAHNGVVDVPLNHSYDLKTKNDTEFLANLFYDKGIQGLSDVSGYYAFISLEKNIWTIARDNDATLFCGKLSKNDSLIFSTKKEDIIEIAKLLESKVTNLREVIEYSYITITDGLVTGHGELPEKTVLRVKDSKYLTSIGNEKGNDKSKAWNDLDDSDFSFYRPVKSASMSDLFDLGYEQGVEDYYEGVKFQYDSSSMTDESYSEGYSQGYNSVYKKYKVG